MKNRVILIIAILAIGAIVWRYYPHRAKPGPGAPIVEVKVPELDASARTGQVAFNEKCAACHGANASGQEGVAPPLVHKIYEPGHHGDQSFHLAAQRGVRNKSTGFQHS